MTMTNRPVAPKVLMLCVPFVMLVAAKPYLRLHWMYLGLSGSLFLLIACLMLPVSVAWDGRRFAMALLTTYLWHQFEEHGVDIYGNRYAFQTSANKLLGPMLGCTPPGNSECPLTVDAIFWANTLLVWWPNALALTFGGERRQLLVCAAGVTLANTFAHVVPAMVMKSYNPGLVSVLFYLYPWTLQYYGMHAEFGGQVIVQWRLDSFGAHWDTRSCCWQRMQYIGKRLRQRGYILLFFSPTLVFRCWCRNDLYFKFSIRRKEWSD
ncbi:hypothetical protein ACHAXH_008262 [Discostella pseudostelligera]|jgi:hypothetical protein